MRRAYILKSITMETTEKKVITVATTIQAPVEKVWEIWNDPAHITQWNAASADWHTPWAENELKVGGKLLSRMEARDGSMGFDFEGEYTAIETHKRIVYTIADGRKVEVIFTGNGNETAIAESFEAEGTNPPEMQQAGWQAILDNFKQYAESVADMEPLHVDVTIHADAETVFRNMLGEKSFKQWSAAFDPTSYYDGKWEDGEKMLFIGCDSEGRKFGMVSRIEQVIPGKYVSIFHIGVVMDGKEMTGHSAETAGWAGSREIYTLEETDGQTVVSVDVDVNKEHKAQFAKQWPEALRLLKALCENSL